MLGQPVNLAERDMVAAGRGTLDVALATPEFIVVATDSRRTSGTGGHEDASKKLFAIRQRCVLAIAGLADAAIVGMPWLTAQIAPLLDSEIAKATEIDDYYWNDPRPPNTVRGEFKQYWRTDPLWWVNLAGPVQTIMNIAATFGDIDLGSFALEGILAGFKDNGQAKLERLVMIPQKGLSAFGRPYVGAMRTAERTHTSGPLIWKTAGITSFADLVLGNRISGELEGFARSYPGIGVFLDRARAKSVRNMSSSEMIALAKDLVRATADRVPTVGGPIQMAALTPNGRIHVEQQPFPDPGTFLPADGTWHLGVAFTSDYPFDERRRQVVYTSCEIVSNRIPIPLGDNHFYGNTFQRATFVYNGGRVSFGDNNVVEDSCLTIGPGVDETPLQPIVQYFATVDRQLPPDATEVSC
jgi:hypothetical protein